jgi:uncharacterized protein (TIGR02271 family)
MTTTLVALYDDVTTARRVVDDLVNHGFDRNDISLIARDPDEEYATYARDDYSDTGTEAAEGAGIGAVVGGIGGLLVGLGALAIPGVGPVIAAGPIVGALTGAGVGAVAGGIIGALVDMGLPEEEAHYYAEGVRRGGTLVSAQVPDSRVEEAVDIMEHYSPVDVDERAGYWRQSGWNRFENESTPMTSRDIDQDYQRYGVDRSARRDYSPYQGRTTGKTADTGARRTRDTADEETFEVVEEDVQVGKREVDRGGVRVRRHIVEKPIEKQVTLSETHVNVERRPVDRPASDADLSNLQDQTIEVHETAEEAVVRKQARVTEEVHVSKDRQQHTETIRDTARRTEVDVEQIGKGESSADWSRYEPEFRRHYETNYKTTNYPYERYERAYRYGHQLGQDDRYRNADWQTVESTARRDWETRYSDSPWQNFKDSVRHGWERTKDAVR